MYWTSAVASFLGNAPWEGGITKEELVDYAERNGAPQTLLDDLRALEDDGEEYFDLEDLGIEVPTSDSDFGWYGEE